MKDIIPYTKNGNAADKSGSCDPKNTLQVCSDSRVKTVLKYKQ